MKFLIIKHPTISNAVELVHDLGGYHIPEKVFISDNKNKAIDKAFLYVSNLIKQSNKEASIEASGDGEGVIYIQAV